MTARPCLPTSRTRPSTGSICAPPNAIESLSWTQWRRQPERRAGHGLQAHGGRAGALARRQRGPPVALVRAGATFVDGVKVEREVQRSAA